MLDQPTISIIIPTHDRRDSLLRALTALSVQDYPADRIELIVVCDGCTDGSADAVRAFPLGFPARVIEQSNLGPGGARNVGAAVATGDYLVFLDDDVEASSGLVSAHVLAHQRVQSPQSVVIGYYPTRISFQTGLYRANLLHWWETIFDTMAEPAYRFAYTDMLSGNFSLRRELFDEAGGFSTDLRCHEDYELGYRLIKANAVFRFDRDAWGHHYETSDFRRSLVRQFEEGKADAQIARLHPELIPGLRFAWADRAKRAFSPSIPRRAARALLRRALPAAMTVADRLRLRALWKKCAFKLFELHYWKGVVKATGSLADYRQVLGQQIPAPSEWLPEVDLANGIEAAEAAITAIRPCGLTVRYGDQPIGTIVCDPLRERLHGSYLRAWLGQHKVYDLVQVLGLEQVRARADTQRLLGATPAEPEPEAGPAVTVIIPAHNAALTLGETLDSLLAQSRHDWDAVIVDDSSTDATPDIIAAYVSRDARFRTIRIDKRSAGEARNAGLAQGGAGRVLFLDSDDMIDPDMIAKMFDAFDDHPDAALIHCGWRCVAPSGDILSEDHSSLVGDQSEEPMRRCPFAIHACVVNRSVLAAAGPFDPELRTNEDFDLWRRVALTGAHFASIPDTLVTYRMRTDHGWFDPESYIRDGFTVMHRAYASNSTMAMGRGELCANLHSMVLYAAGMEIARGRSFGRLFDLAADLLRDAGLPVSAMLDPGTSADLVLAAIPLTLGRPQSYWPSLWPERAAAIAELFAQAESRLGSPGLAFGALRALERKLTDFLDTDGRIGATVFATIAADQAISFQPPPGALILRARICYAEDDLGEIVLPICDGRIDPEMLANAIAATFGWTILGRYFARHVYPRLTREEIERRMSNEASGLPASLRSGEPALHDAIGWSSLLVALWGDCEDLYAPLPEIQSDAADRAPVTVEIGAALPRLEGLDDAALVALQSAGSSEGLFLVPAEDGIISPKRLASAVTQAVGFDLCRIVVRDALVGFSADDPGSIAERLARKPRRDQSANILILGRWPSHGALTRPGRGVLPAACADEVIADAAPGQILQIPDTPPSSIVYLPGLMPRPLQPVHAAAESGQDDEAMSVRHHFEHLFAQGRDPWTYESAYEQTKYEQTLSLIPASRPARALELACAEGHFTVQLAPLVDHLTAADISQIALDRTRERLTGRADLDFVQLDLGNDPIPGGYDLITCSEVLYYLPDREALRRLAEKLAAALVPGGYLVHAHANVLVDDPNAPGYDWTVPFGAKGISETFAANPDLVLDSEIVTPIYRVQRFRRRDGSEASEPRSLVGSYAMPEPHVAERIKWNGGIVAPALATGAIMTEKLPILMYHNIADHGPESLRRFRTSPAAFEEQLRYLRDAGFRSASFAEWREARLLRRPLPGNRVLLTFDDGYRDFHDNAWPLLQKYGFGATVFLVADKIGATSDWDERYGETAPLMDEEQIRRLAAEGVDFASHGSSHTPLTGCDWPALAAELLRSRSRIEQLTGTPVSTLCYPFGLFRDDLAHFAQAVGYAEAVTTIGGSSALTEPAFALRRLEVRGGAGVREFIELLAA